MSESPEKRRRGIENLLVERKKVESWIAQLDAKRATTAAHVFVRVHADYAVRLDDVRSRLGNEAEGIRALVAELETRLATEQRLVTEKNDERAEAELRASVGEFSDKEWASTKGKLDSAIDDLRAKFDGTERELADLKGVLPSIAAAPAPRTSGVSTPLPALDEVAASGPARTAAPSPLAAAAAAAASPSKAPMAPPRPSAPAAFDELAFLKSVAGTPITPITPAKLVGAASRAAPVAAEPPARPPRGRPSSKSALDDADAGPLGGPTPRTSQAIRSLKCQECGTLNFPTEWYCERCGGELAAF